jgi:hypothetical protein
MQLELKTIRSMIQENLKSQYFDLWQEVLGRDILNISKGWKH